MIAYLREHKPARTQFRSGRRLDRSPARGHVAGVTVLHTAESVMDSVGPDTGAEAVARFIRGRAEPGSYHDLVDSDSCVHLVRYEDEAYQDGTGSNPWALSLSFACRTTDWARMSPARRAGFLTQGAAAFARQQAWRRENGHPLTELRLITRAQSDRGVSGFVYHGMRDPGRRTDPGTTQRAAFPFAEFAAACRAALGGTAVQTPIPTEQKDWFDMAEIKDLETVVNAALVAQLAEVKDDLDRVRDVLTDHTGKLDRIQREGRVTDDRVNKAGRAALTQDQAADVVADLGIPAATVDALVTRLTAGAA